jgi:DNA-binding response OmpR family regulator
MLRLKGYEVHTAATLDHGHQKIADGNYKLVIVDVGHFAEPGLKFCEEIKAQHPGLKVLMQVDHHVFLGRHSCPDQVISKQEGPQDFIDEVESMLQSA